MKNIILRFSMMNGLSKRIIKYSAFLAFSIICLSTVLFTFDTPLLWLEYFLKRYADMYVSGAVSMFFLSVTAGIMLELKRG